MTVFAYLVYGGNPNYQLEMSFSLLSAVRQAKSPDALRVALICDPENARPDLPVENVVVEHEELRSWTDDGRYNHRIKPLAIRRLLERYDEPVVMLDTDTYFTDDPEVLAERVGPGQTLMHELESSLGDAALWGPLLQQRGGRIEAGEHVLTPDLPMYNSGIIGLRPEDAGLLDDAMEILDALRAETGFFNAEQLAIGLAFERATKVATGDDVLVHYWGGEREFIHLRVQELMGVRDGERFAAAAAASTLPAITGYPPIPISYKLRGRALGTAFRWSEDYYYAYVAALMARAEARPGYAKAWNDVARHALKLAGDRDGLPAHPLMERDFGALLARWEPGADEA
ncbi:MAG: hypothetical protein AAGH15_10255 [Myxococcota bacterium]